MAVGACQGQASKYWLPLVAKRALLRASFGDSALHSQRGFPRWETSGVGSPPSSHLTIHPTASPVKSLNFQAALLNRVPTGVLRHT